MKQGKVSMVVPCYNKVEYIGEFFQSVYDQVWDNIELILVNDGCTDGTREIIGQWEERFAARGYSVRIIDQENRGVSAAVKAGLECVIGDYFCIPDCDDVLHPEYVSKMLSILISDESALRVVCDGSAGSYLINNSCGLWANYYSGPTKLEYNLINCFLLGRVKYPLWNCMCRSSCLGQLIEAYQVDFRYSQEFQAGLILGYIGNTVYLPELLYFYRMPKPDSRVHTKDYASICEFISAYHDVIEKVIGLLPFEESLRDKILDIAKLGYAFDKFRHRLRFEQPDDEDILEGACALAEVLIPLKNKIGRIANNRLSLLWWAISNYLIGYENPFQGGHYTPNKKGRVIGYGAYGKAAKELLPLALDSPLKPDVLWDMAQGEREVMGIPVTRPDIAGLTPDDTVLVFISSRKIAAEVYDLLAKGQTDNILYYYDILDYFADFYFPLQLD